MLLLLTAPYRPEVCVDLWLLLALTVLAVIGVVALCRRFVFCLQCWFETACDRLEVKLATRKARRRPPTFPTAHQPQTVESPATNDARPNLTDVPKVIKKRPVVTSFKPRVVNAHDALRRSCLPSE